MPKYICGANGVASSAAVWQVVDQTSVSYLNDEAASTVMTTSYVESAPTTPGAITIDGIAVKVARRVASPTGTISVRLAQAAATVAGTEVTINVSDIPYGVGIAADSNHNGWIFFKFPAPVLLVVATAYTVSAKCSSASQVHLWRNSTAGNWNRMLRTTTFGSIVAGDDFHVLGEWTAAATVTTRAVTWDIAAATDFGSTSLVLASVSVGVGGTMTFGVTGSVNHNMRLSGVFDVCVGGALNMGTIGTPCPRDASQQIEFDCAADGDFGLRVFGTFSGQGLSRIAASTLHYVLLNTDEAIGQTTLGVDGQLSARNGDIVAIASTTRTNADAESVTMGADAGASTLTVGAIAVAHSGTSPTQAEVVCLNRDVRLISVSSTFMAYVFFADTGVADLDWVEFRYMGHASTVQKRGVEIQTVTGSFNANKCSIRDFDNHGFYVTGTAFTGVTITDCVGYKVGHQTSSHCCINIATASTAAFPCYTLTGNVFISDNTGSGVSINLLDFGGVCSNNRVSSGGGAGFAFGETATPFFTGTFSDNLAHSMGTIGFSITAAFNGGVWTNLTVWRCNGTAGFQVGAHIQGLTIDGMTLFGNSGANIFFTAAPLDLTFRDFVSNGDSTFATTNGLQIQLTSGVYFRVRIEDGNFGTVSGIKTAHTNDINIVNAANYCDLYLIDTILASATEILNTAGIIGYSSIYYQRHEGVATAVRRHYIKLGTVSKDTVTVHTSAVSEKLEPITTGAKLPSSVKRVAVGSGQSAAMSVWVNKGVTYDGASPRLRVKQNSSAGINEATVDTHAGAAGSFVELQGTVGPVAEDCYLEFFIDTDGTTGQANVADWSASVS